MDDGEGGDDRRTSYADELNAQRLSRRIAAVTHRASKPVPVLRADGTVLLRGRRRVDRDQEAGDRRAGERRTPA